MALKKSSWLVIMLLTLSMALAYAPELPGVNTPVTNIGTSNSKILNLLKSQAIIDTIKYPYNSDGRYSVGNVVTFPSDTLTIGLTCPGGKYYYISEFYTSTPNSLGKHNGVDYVDPEKYGKAYGVDYHQKIYLYDGGVGRSYSYEWAFELTPDVFQRGSGDTWSVSRYIACINSEGWKDVTSPIRADGTTGAVIHQFKVNKQSNPPPLECSSGDVRCKPTTNTVQKCVNQQWNDAFDCTKIHSTCLNEKKLANLQLAYATPAQLCQTLPCVPNWKFAPTQECTYQLSGKPQPGSWIDANNCNTEINKPKQPETCPIKNYCEEHPKDPECAPGPVTEEAKKVKISGLTLYKVSALHTASVEQKNFNIFDRIGVKLQIDNPSNQEFDKLNLEIAIYDQDYVNSIPFFQKAQLFALKAASGIDTKELAGCARFTNKDCENNPYCESFVKGLQIIKVPPLSQFTIPTTEVGDFSDVVWFEENQLPQSQSVFVNGETNFNTEGAYSVVAYFYNGGCGTGDVWSPIKRDITITCPDISQISEDSGIEKLTAHFGESIAERCLNATIVEECKDEMGKAGLLVKGKEFRACLSTKQTTQLYENTNIKSQSINAKKIKTVPVQTLADYACAYPQNCPDGSNCINLKTLKERNYLLEEQASDYGRLFKGVITAVGGVAGCAYGLSTSFLPVTAGATLVKDATGAVIRSTVSQQSILQRFGVNPLIPCGIGAAIGGGVGYGVASLLVGIEDYLTKTSTNPDEHLGLCVIEGTEELGVLDEISDKIGLSPKTITAIVLVVVGLYLFKIFFGK